MCDCCDHPLQHAIRQAVATYENAVPPLKAQNVITQLKMDLETWEDR